MVDFCKFVYSRSPAAHKKSLLQWHNVYTQTQWLTSCTKGSMTSIKVCCTQAVLQTHTYTHTQQQQRREYVPSSEAVEWVGAVAYRCSVSHSSCWSCREVSAQENREPRHSGIETEWNMRSHSQPRSPQHLKLLALPTACEQSKSTLVGEGVWHDDWSEFNRFQVLNFIFTSKIKSWPMLRKSR